MGIAKILLTVHALLLLAVDPAASGELSDGLLAFRRGQYSIAAERLRSLAMRGNSEAQTTLGFMYEYGRGVPQDEVVAAQWYLCAADQGNADALYQLGLMFDKGLGVPLSSMRAYELLNLAAARAKPGQRDYYLRLRDAVATKLNRSQIVAAQARARIWSPRSGPCG